MAGPTRGRGWELGVDIAYLRALCDHWARAYDWRRLETRLNELDNRRWEGIHLIRQRGGGEGLPVLLVHGWPGGPIEFLDAMPLARRGGARRGRSVPSRIRMVGRPRCAAQRGGDVRAPAGADGGGTRIRALRRPGRGLGGEHLGPDGLRLARDGRGRSRQRRLGASGSGRPRRSAAHPAEQAYIETGSRWRRRHGFHLFLQSAAPDAVAVGFNDSPAGLAAWLVEKYRRWSDCGGDVERRFSRDELCDFLTMYWATGTIASSMRLYLGERSDRWRLGPGERIEVPAAAADFPAEIVRPPREWAERIFADLQTLDGNAPGRPLRRLRGAAAVRRRRGRVPRAAVSSSRGPAPLRGWVRWDSACLPPTMPTGGRPTRWAFRTRTSPSSSRPGSWAPAFGGCVPARRRRDIGIAPKRSCICCSRGRAGSASTTSS